MKEKIQIVLIVILSLGVGFFMEWFKVDVNWVLEKSETIPDFFELNPEERFLALNESPKGAVYDYYHNHRHIFILNYFSKGQLWALKWGSTLVFCGLFLILSRELLRLFKSPHLKELHLIYFSGLIIAISAYAAGKLLGLDLYPFSRLIVGFLQSIIPSAILIILGLYKKRANE